MKVKNWIRVTNVQPYIDSEDLADYSYAIAHRLYSPKGEAYPVFFIGIYGNVGYFLDKKPITGIHISSSYKNKSGEW